MAEKIVKTKYFAVQRKVKEDDKVAPQALAILEALPADKTLMSREDLIEVISDGRLNTKQDPSRILSFYRPKLIDAGLLKEVVKEEKVEVEDAEVAPPVKEVKAKKATSKKGTKLAA